MTAIEWCHRPGTVPKTWNPIVAFRNVTDPQTGETKRLRGWYCEHATTGCINCYSETQNEAGYRGGTKLPFKPGHRGDVEIELHEPTLLQPLHWKKPHTIFVCSMSDLYGYWVKDEWLDKIKAVQALTPQHTYIDLTKRPERMRDYMSDPDHAVRWFRIIDDEWAEAWRDLSFKGVTPNTVPSNCWLGVSAERQQEADERIPLLLQTPAAVRFVSLEPLLGPICVTYLEWARLDWVIVGGESGPHARPMHPDWARSLRDQCAAAGVPFFFKQWGQYAQGAINSEIMVARNEVHHFVGAYRAGIGSKGSYLMCNVGKKAAGRLLDGKEHSEFPSTDQTKRSAA